MKPRTAKQINAPQCGEAWTAYMVGDTNHAATHMMERLFESLGIKLKTVKATWPNDKRSKTKSKRASRRGRTTKHRARPAE